MTLEEKIRFVYGNGRQEHFRNMNKILQDLYDSQWFYYFTSKGISYDKPHCIEGTEANKGIMYVELMYKLLKDDSQAERRNS